MSNSKKIVIGAIALLIGAFFPFDLGQFLELQALKEHQGNPEYADCGESVRQPRPAFRDLCSGDCPVTARGNGNDAGGWCPVRFGWGLVIISFASTIGATLAFLVARFLFRDTLQRRYAAYLKKIDEGIHRDGAFYLATLRLIPVFPFFVINIVMGLTGMKTWTFYWVSQLAMLPGTAVYVNAGTTTGPD